VNQCRSASTWCPQFTLALAYTLVQPYQRFAMLDVLGQVSPNPRPRALSRRAHFQHGLRTALIRWRRCSPIPSPGCSPVRCSWKRLRLARHG